MSETINRFISWSCCFFACGLGGGWFIFFLKKVTVQTKIQAPGMALGMNISWMLLDMLVQCTKLTHHVCCGGSKKVEVPSETSSSTESTSNIEGEFWVFGNLCEKKIRYMEFLSCTLAFRQAICRHWNPLNWRWFQPQNSLNIWGGF